MAIKEPGLIGRQDKLLTFGETGALSATGAKYFGATSDLTDGVALDLNAGDLEGMSVHFAAKASLDGTGTVTATFFVQVSDDKSNWTKIATTDTIGKADLAAGAEINLPIPRGHKAGRYMRCGVTLAGTTITGGNFTAMVDTFAGV